MTPSAGRPDLDDELARLCDLVDRLSPGLLGLACCVCADDGSADRMVETAWQAWLALPEQWRATAGPPTVAVARQLTRAHSDDDVDLARSRQRLHLVLQGRDEVAVPAQRPRATGPGGLPGQLVGLPTRQRLVVVLHDVHRWSADDVGTLLGLGPRELLDLLGRARHALWRSRTPA